MRLLSAFLLTLLALPAAEPLYDQKNLAAWCIVPFDNQKRTPEQRATMVAKMGITKVAYDWRAEHVAEFEQEILAYKKHGIEYFAFWAYHEEAFRLFEKHQLHPQIWVIAGGKGDTQEAKVKSAAEGLLPTIAKAAAIGSKVAIYNHGGWGGEPENMVAVCEYLKKNHAVTNIGVVYNLHHGHGHLERLDEVLKLMLPHLLCLNLNGMDVAGDAKGRKILPIGAGTQDLKVLRQVRASGYAGVIGILNHTMEDAEGRLLDNLDGLRHLVPQLDDLPPGPKTKYRTFAVGATATAKPTLVVADETPKGEPSSSTEFGKALRGGQVVAASPEAFRWPCTVEARVRLDSKKGFNIIAAGGPKSSPRHWELYSHQGSGYFSVYLPGRGGDFSSKVDITDGKWHDVLASLDDQVVTLWVDGKIVLERAPKPYQEAPVPDKLAFGRLVEGGIGCDGLVDDVRISRGVMKPRKTEGPRLPMDNTIGLWSFDALGAAAPRGPTPPIATFAPERAPLRPEQDPHAAHPVNRDRVFDFYAKQAVSFAGVTPQPALIPSFSGLDGGKQGHWGNQNDAVTWKDGRWGASDLGTLFSGVLRVDGMSVTKAVWVRKGDEAAAFDPVTLSFRARWRGGFVRLSETRHGFASGPAVVGKTFAQEKNPVPPKGARYLGFYRHGEEVIFAYEQDGRRRLVAAWQTDEATLEPLTRGGPARWSKELMTPITRGTQKPFAVDTIGVPFENPYGALFFISGIDFLPDGAAAVSTMTGEVWLVRGLAGDQAVWRRYATGLHQALGVKVVEGKVLVLGRDQITRLHDLNGDGEADYHECLFNRFATSPGGHDFVVGLERDEAGRFYVASGNQGLLRLTLPDKVDVLASGLRNPNGVGVSADGRFITSSVQEGDWTPSSAVCLVEAGFSDGAHFGWGGPKDGKPPTPPLVHLPRGEDNSSAGQLFLGTGRWPTLAGEGNLLHFSFGTGSAWTISRQKTGGIWQGAAQRLTGAFRSGAQNGRFNPADGHLYVTGMQGWGSYTPDDGCLQRVRHIGGSPVLVGHEVRDNGVLLRFDSPVRASERAKAFAQAWNYRYSRSYGSPEYSVRHPETVAHDVLSVEGVHADPSGRTIFVHLPQLLPCSQLHVRLGEDAEVFLSAHALGEPYKDFSGYRVVAKQPAHAHEAAAVASGAGRPVRWESELCGPDPVVLKIQAGSALNYLQKELNAKAGRAVALTFENPDVMPHNWVLVKPGAEERVGTAAALMVSLPDGMDRHYVPETADVLVHTRILEPGKKTTVYFTAPKEPGRYTYLCTFPGHSQLMRGVLVVD
jgi:azurin/sugar phosphate isomerase/epimerase